MWRMLSRKVFYFTVSPAACAAVLTAYREDLFGCVSPGRSVHRLSDGRLSLQPRCLSGTADPWEIHILLFLLLLSNQRPAQRAEHPTCRRAVVGKYYICVQHARQSLIVNAWSPLRDSSFRTYVCLLTTSNGQRPFEKDLVVPIVAG